MSKSLGNLVFVSDLLKEWEPAAIRLAILAHHYRTPWDWDDALMPAAAERLERWRAAGEGDGALDEVRAALDDDLDTPARPGRHRRGRRRRRRASRAPPPSSALRRALAALALRPPARSARTAAPTRARRPTTRCPRCSRCWRAGPRR